MTAVALIIYATFSFLVAFKTTRWFMIRRMIAEREHEEETRVVMSYIEHQESRRRLGPWPPARERTPEQQDLDDFRAAWIEPNEDFIRSTDKILGDIEWKKVNDDMDERKIYVNRVDPDEVAPPARLR